MAVDITDIRETIGINDKPIAICAMQGINIIKPKHKSLEVGNSKKRDVNSTELAENMIIAVSTGNNPNKQEDVEIDK